ncbi:hypothetical protein D3C80_1704270 [compost metagenome]
MLGYIIISHLFGITYCRFEGRVNRVAFWRAGQIDDSLSNRPFALRRADAGKAVPGRNGYLHATRVGIPHIFRSNRQQPARHIQWIAPGGNNTCIPVQRSIRR